MMVIPTIEKLHRERRAYTAYKQTIESDRDRNFPNLTTENEKQIESELKITEEHLSDIQTKISKLFNKGPKILFKSKMNTVI